MAAEYKTGVKGFLSGRNSPDVSGAEGRWQQDTSLVLMAFQEKGSGRHLLYVSGNEEWWQQEIFARD